MLNYYYNTPYVDFYLKDDTNVHVEQIEHSPIFSLELFPKNQSKASYENAEFSCFFNMQKFINDNELDIEDLNTPDNWTIEQYREFKQTLIEFIKTIQLDKAIEL